LLAPDFQIATPFVGCFSTNYPAGTDISHTQPIAQVGDNPAAQCFGVRGIHKSADYGTINEAPNHPDSFTAIRNAISRYRHDHFDRR
jgi:hypothetical protein